ncbi:unnamed protein product, partial [Prorocentrum cordatum]
RRRGAAAGPAPEAVGREGPCRRRAVLAGPRRPALPGPGDVDRVAAARGRAQKGEGRAGGRVDSGCLSPADRVQEGEGRVLRREVPRAGGVLPHHPARGHLRRVPQPGGGVARDLEALFLHGRVRALGRAPGLQALLPVQQGRHGAFPVAVPPVRPQDGAGDRCPVPRLLREGRRLLGLRPRWAARPLAPRVRPGRAGGSARGADPGHAARGGPGGRRLRPGRCPPRRARGLGGRRRARHAAADWRHPAPAAAHLEAQPLRRRPAARRARLAPAAPRPRAGARAGGPRAPADRRRGRAGRPRSWRRPRGGAVRRLPRPPAGIRLRGGHASLPAADARLRPALHRRRARRALPGHPGLRAGRRGEAAVAGPAVRGARRARDRRQGRAGAAGGRAGRGGAGGRQEAAGPLRARAPPAARGPAAGAGRRGRGRRGRRGRGRAAPRHAACALGVGGRGRGLPRAAAGPVQPGGRRGQLGGPRRRPQCAAGPAGHPAVMVDRARAAGLRASLRPAGDGHVPLRPALGLRRGGGCSGTGAPTMESRGGLPEGDGRPPRVLPVGGRQQRRLLACGPGLL